MLVFLFSVLYNFFITLCTFIIVSGFIFSLMFAFYCLCEAYFILLKLCSTSCFTLKVICIPSLSVSFCFCFAFLFPTVSLCLLRLFQPPLIDCLLISAVPYCKFTEAHQSQTKLQAKEASFGLKEKCI